MDQPDHTVASNAELYDVEAPVVTSAVPAPAVQFRSNDVETIVMSAFEAHAERLRAFALASVRDHSVADDMVQETYLRLVREVQSGPPPANMGAWLFRVCANLIVSRGRRRSVAQRFLSGFRERRVEASAEESVMQRHEGARLREALAELPVDARVALLMAAQGADSATIAEAIGRSTAATRTYICRSRLRLREILAGPAEASS